MKTLNIQIPNMQSKHCQLRVKNGLASIDGITINNIEPGSASLSVENEAQQSEALQVITKLGYNINTVESLPQSNGEGEPYSFKTNINCEGCIAQVSRFLNGAEGISHWSVNTNSKDKILLVQAIGITKQEVINRVKEAGFNIEIVNQ